MYDDLVVWHRTVPGRLPSTTINIPFILCICFFGAGNRFLHLSGFFLSPFSIPLLAKNCCELGQLLLAGFDFLSPYISIVVDCTLTNTHLPLPFSCAKWLFFPPFSQTEQICRCLLRWPHKGHGEMEGGKDRIIAIQLDNQNRETNNNSKVCACGSFI